MKIIHGGTVIQTVFHVVDDEGNVVQSINAVPSQEQKEEPLRVKQLKAEGFSQAFQALEQIKANLQKQADEQGKIDVPADNDGETKEE